MGLSLVHGNDKLLISGNGGTEKTDLVRDRLFLVQTREKWGFGEERGQVGFGMTIGRHREHREHRETSIFFFLDPMVLDWRPLKSMTRFTSPLDVLPPPCSLVGHARSRLPLLGSTSYGIRNISCGRQKMTNTK